MLRDADLLWALWNMVPELTSYLRPVIASNVDTTRENIMTAISIDKFQICCCHIRVFGSGFVWKIHLISNLGLRFQLSFSHN